MWNDLTMKQRADLIARAVKAGVRDISTIRAAYDDAHKHGDGGFNIWKRDIANHKGINVDNDNSYDYYSFYKENPQDAYGMLQGNPKAHFKDTYKTAWHPSFSTESRYSGNVNVYNPKGIVGGSWLETGNPKLEKYEFSDSQIDKGWDINGTLNEFEWARKNEDVKPYAVYKGGMMLPELSIKGKKRKHANGGHLYGDGGDGIFGNDAVDTVVSFLPYGGSAEDVYTAIKKPSWANVGWAVASVGADLLTGGYASKAIKAARVANRELEVARQAQKLAVKEWKAAKKANAVPTRATTTRTRHSINSVRSAGATADSAAKRANQAMFNAAVSTTADTGTQTFMNLIQMKAQPQLGKYRAYGGHLFEDGDRLTHMRNAATREVGKVGKVDDWGSMEMGRILGGKPFDMRTTINYKKWNGWDGAPDGYPFDISYANGGHLYDGDTEPVNLLDKAADRKNYMVVPSGVNDTLTLKDNNPMTAYLGEQLLEARDMGNYIMYSDGNHVWSYSKEPNSGITLLTDYLGEGLSKQEQSRKFVNDIIGDMTAMHDASMQKALVRDELKKAARIKANAGRTTPYQYNPMADIQDNLWEMGAYKGIINKTGKEVSYEDIMSGAKDEYTKRAIRNARVMGYTVNGKTGEIAINKRKRVDLSYGSNPAVLMGEDLIRSTLNNAYRGITGDDNATLIPGIEVTSLPKKQMDVLRKAIQSKGSNNYNGGFTGADWRRLQGTYTGAGRSLADRVFNPQSAVEHTLGQFDYAQDPRTGEVYVMDTYDFNVGQGSPGQGAYSSIRDFMGKYGSKSSDPRKGKITFRLNLGRPDTWNK